MHQEVCFNGERVFGHSVMLMSPFMVRSMLVSLPLFARDKDE